VVLLGTRSGVAQEHPASPIESRWEASLTTYQPVGMVVSMPPGKSKASAKARLLDVAVNVIRAKGYSATTVDELCQTAGVTKGAFFHHFDSKEDLAVAAARHFSSIADGLFSTAPYRELADPVDRLLGYVDFRKALLRGEPQEFTCLLGTMVQEAYQTHPEIRQACGRYLGEHTAMLELDIAEALRTYGGDGQWSAESLAVYMQAVIQGAFIFAKAQKGPVGAAACLDHLRRYIQTLFSYPKKRKPHGPQERRNRGPGARRARHGGVVRARLKSTLSAHGSDSSVPHE
jgi:TetR/AcrR family transcriptional regulator, transcriptional repressor for nem operon